MARKTCELEPTLARAGVYGFFSGVLLREFNEYSLAELKSPRWRKALLEHGIDLPDTPELMEELAIDYCRIFIGPGKFCPPIQSVWTNGQFQGHVVDSMREFLDIVSVDHDCPVKDHAGLQMEVMAKILEFKSSHSNQSNGLAECFYRSHIGWTQSMLNRAAELAVTDLYRGLMTAAVDFIQQENKRYDFKPGMDYVKPAVFPASLG